MGWLAIVGWGALGAVAVLWLVVSFTPASPRRAVLEWLASTCLYAALLALFTHLIRRAQAEDSTLGLVAFGFLAALFAAGLAVSLFHLLRSLRGGGSEAKISATN